MSTFVHVGEGPKQSLDNITISAEAKYPNNNFIASGKRCLVIMEVIASIC